MIYERDSVIFMSCPQMQSMAEDLVSRFRTNFVGDRRLKIYPRYSPISWGKFPDKYDNIHLDPEAVRNNHIWFFSSLDDPMEVFRQLSVLRAIPGYGARTLNIVLPYYPTGTMDRVQSPGDIVTAETLASMFEVIPTKTCRTCIYIFDIHDTHEDHYFPNNLVVFPETAVTHLILKVASQPSYMPVAFSDEGAEKRFKHLVTNFKKIICQKVRRNEERIVTIKEGEVAGKNIILLDDLTRTGGTIIEGIKVLKQHGAHLVNVVVSHCPLDPGAREKLIAAHQQGLIAHFFTTDSCPEAVRQLQGLSFVTIVPLNDLLEEIVVREEF